MSTTVTTSGLQLIAIDSHGNCFSELFDSYYDTVQVCGLRKLDGDSYSFESELMHFGSDLDGTGIQYKIVDVSVTTTVDFD